MTSGNAGGHPSVGQEIYRGPRYLVRRVTLNDGRTVIHKVPRPDRSDAASVARLRHEREILNELRGLSGVESALGLEEIDGTTVLVLDDAGTRTLAETCAGAPLELGRFFQVAITLAETVGGVHGAAVIHRDLNPSNVVLDDEGRPTLIDMGLATRATAVAASAADEMSGTVLYVAPEQTGRTNRFVDHRADLYSLGATYYAMLTGEPPFSGEDRGHIVHAHLARTPVAPAVANPAVPEIVSSLVLKLLAKMPERRYQSAGAVAADLKEAQKRWAATGTVAPFPLGRGDRAGALLSFGQLYGRESERAELARAFERTCAGERQVVLVSGSSGIGKTALVASLSDLVGERALLLSGGAEEDTRTVPFRPLQRALSELASRLVGGPPEHLALERQICREAVGANGALLADIVPGLATLLGPFPASEAPGPNASPPEVEARLHLALTSFIRACARPERPLVLIVEDLHSADRASIRLLEALATDPALRHLLLVITARPEEAKAGLAPLARIRRALETAGRPGIVVELGALDRAAVVGLLAEALACGPQRAAPLAHVLLEKTGGIPLMLRRFLGLLHESGLLRFDPVRGEWDWDVAEVRGASISDDMVQVMSSVLRALPPATVGALKIATCLGMHVDLWLLAAALGEPRERVAGRLWPAIQQRVLLPTARPRFEPSTDEGDDGDSAVRRASYRFFHDRVRQAAAAMLSSDEARLAHLEIGQALLRATVPAEQEERLFDIAEHLVRGAQRADLATVTEIAAWAARAGRKAMRAGALQGALGYLRRALDLDQTRALPDRSLLLRDAAVTATFEREPDAQALLDAALAESRSLPERVETYRAAIVTLSTQTRMADAVLLGRRALAELGASLPEPSEMALAARRELEILQRNWADRTPSDVLNAPRIEDAVARAQVDILESLLTVAWQTNRDLLSFAVARIVNLSLVHGNCLSSTAGYMQTGVLWSTFLRQPLLGRQLAGAALALARAYRDPVQESRALFVLGASVAHWTGPLYESATLLRQAVALGSRAGDLTFAATASTSLTMTLFALGVSLVDVLAETESSLLLAERAHTAGIPSVLAYRQAIRALLGRTQGPGRFDDHEFSEEAFVQDNATRPVRLCLYETARLQVAYLFRDLETAWAMSRSAEGRLQFTLGFISTTEFTFFTALTAAARADADPDAKQVLATCAQRLATWAATYPANFAHRHHLVSAEIARLEGRATDAVSLYDQAMDEAAAGDFVQDQALASELRGRFEAGRGRAASAAVHLAAAADAYARWGATAKVRALVREFPRLRLSRDALAMISTTESAQGEVDLGVVLKAAEAISQEIAFPRLLRQLMAVCLEAAGAERGALILEESAGPTIQVIAGVSEPTSLEPRPLDGAERGLVPRQVVEHARATRAPVLLDDAIRDGLFAGDPYVVERHARSILALPIIRQGNLVAVLYLENNLLSHVFSTGRMRLIEMLSSQIAISLENSRLFERLTREVDERRRAEGTVRFLADAGGRLSASLDYEATLAATARLAVPFLADWCLVDLVEGEQIRPVAAAHADPVQNEKLQATRPTIPLGWDSARLPGLVLRTGEAMVLTEVTEAFLRENIESEEILRATRALGPRSAMLVPLSARGFTIGVMTLAWTREGRRYTNADLPVAQELARRASSAIDNARLYQEAQDAVASREEFLWVAAHELRTPLTALQLSVQGLIGVPTSSKEEATARSLALIEKQTRRLGHLVDQLLDVSRIQAGRLQLHLEDVDLSELTREVADHFSRELARARCALTLKVEASVVGVWDRSRLEQVVTNLLSNAVKFGAGHPIEVQVERHADRARLVVQDHGIGVAPDRLPFIFERFERAVSVRSYGGLGLGLFITRTTVEALGGTVSAESEPGAGARFTVDLPCAGPPRPPGAATT